MYVLVLHKVRGLLRTEVDILRQINRATACNCMGSAIVLIDHKDDETNMILHSLMCHSGTDGDCVNRPRV